MPLATHPVSVVLPVFNEEGAVGAEIQKIQRVLESRGFVHEIIVVGARTASPAFFIECDASSRVP